MSSYAFDHAPNDDEVDFPLPSRTDDSEEVVVEVPVEEHLTAEQKIEVAEIDEIEGFLKEIAEIDPCPVQPLQTTSPFLKEGLMKSMRKAIAEKAKEKESVFNIDLHPMEFKIDDAGDDATLSTSSQKYATLEEAFSEGMKPVAKDAVDEIFANLDENKRLPKGGEKESEIETEPLVTAEYNSEDEDVVDISVPADFFKEKEAPKSEDDNKSAYREQIKKELEEVLETNREDISSPNISYSAAPIIDLTNGEIIDVDDPEHPFFKQKPFEKFKEQKKAAESVDVALTRERILAREELTALRAEGLDAVVQRTQDADSHRDKIVDMRIKQYELSQGKTLASPQRNVKKDTSEEPVAVVEKDLDIPVFGSYKIKREIGSGGHAILYEAVEEITGRRVVLKKENEENGASLEERAKNSIGEARINNEVDHENIMPIQSVVKDADGNVYLVMPFIRDAKKAELTDNRSQKEIAMIGQSLADALSAAHKKGIVHRDVKPENTLIDPKGRPIILDFGIAKVDEKVNPALANSLTGTRFIDDKTAGSVRYMAPEVLEGWKKADEQSDIYSLGKMLYRMAMQSESSIASSDTIKNLKEKGIKEGLVNCIAKAVADPAHRYKTADELAQDLERFIAGDTKETKVLEDVVDFKAAAEVAKEFDAEQKLEGKVEVKDENLVCKTFESKVSRGFFYLSREEFVMLAGKYFTYLNSVLEGFGAKLKINVPEEMHLEFSTCAGKKEIATTSLTQVLSDYKEPWVLKHTCSYSINNIVIPFESENKSVEGFVSFRDNSFEGIVKTKNKQEDDLSKVIGFFSQKFGGKLWGSPYKELHKKGFSVQYALGIIESGNEIEIPTKVYVNDKPLFTFDGRKVGVLRRAYFSKGRAWIENPNLVSDVLITHGEFHKSTRKNSQLASYQKNYFIDIGDCFVLKPGTELPDWMR